VKNGKKARSYICTYHYLAEQKSNQAIDQANNQGVDQLAAAAAVGPPTENPTVQQ